MAVFVWEKMEKRGALVTFEGPEGSGKTTNLMAVAKSLRNFGFEVTITREPGGSKISEQIRKILLDSSNSEILPLTSFLLFSAARFQHTSELIKPRIKAGEIVLCDRFSDSSLAYQGYGLKLDLDSLRGITRLATGELVPDLTLLFDVPVEIGLGRKIGQGEWNRLDAMEIEIHHRILEGYLEMAASEPERWVVIDATQPLDQVMASSWSAVVSFLENRSKEGSWGLGKERSF